MEPLVAEVRSRLIAASDPVFRDGVTNYFKEPIDAYGVRGPELKAIERDVYRVVKTWPPARRNSFFTGLWKSGKMEEGAIVCHVYRRFARQCAGCEFKLFERWIDRYVHNWAHCDGVSAWLVAASIGNEPELALELRDWTRSPNRWKRRSAAVSLLQEAKRGRSTELILEIADRLRRDPDDMVQKGAGWLLKETYPKQPAVVVARLAEWRIDTPRAVLRYAVEKMSAKDRAAALGARVTLKSSNAPHR